MNVAELLPILCCPETHQPLALAPAALIEQLNRQIAARTLRNRDGRCVEPALEVGLLRADGSVLYPVRGGVPVLLIEDAIVIHAGNAG